MRWCFLFWEGGGEGGVSARVHPLGLNVHSAYYL